jgi:signal transduction histidine kinase
MPALWKATPSIALTSAILALLAGLAMGFSNQASHAKRVMRDATVQSEILASTVSAALSFNDQAAAREYVQALSINSDVLRVGVYNARGALFAGFARPPLAAPPANLPAGGTHRDGETQIVVTPVTEGNAALGTIYLETVYDTARLRFNRFAPIALVAIMAAVIAAILGVAGATIQAANAKLREESLKLEDANARLLRQIDQRERAEEALRQAQKMEAIGQLTGGVAHDFNNLLQIILSCLDMMRRRLGKWGLRKEAEDDFQRYLQGALAGGERAAALTRQLLAFARRTPLEPSRLDVNKLVAGMSELLRRTLGEAISVETVLAGGLWPTYADANQLESALVNMAVNARDAMPKGGRLTIETANAALDDAYAAANEDVQAGQYVMIAVSDTGSGMSPDVLTKVFEPFFTTKDIGHGTGLGLSQVYGFVKQSGGHVKIYSELGEGTTVKLYLPRQVNAAPQAAAVATEQAVPRATSAETILVVEDEDAVRAFSVEMLTELGYTVLQAADGAAALRLLDEGAAIDLLFTDVGLPGGMNGRVLADEVEKRRPGTKVLFTSGYTRNAIVHGGKLDAGVALLGKPFTYAALAQKIRQVLG